LKHKSYTQFLKSKLPENDFLIIFVEKYDLITGFNQSFGI